MICLPKAPRENGAFSLEKFFEKSDKNACIF